MPAWIDSSPLGLEAFRFDQFGWQAVLWALAILPALALAMWLRGKAGRSAAPMLYSAEPFAAAGPAGWRSGLAWLPGALRIAALGLVIIAIARPQEISGRTKTRTEGIAMQLVVDRSGSMKEPMRLGGERVSRLEAVKRVATDFVAGDGEELRGREGDLIGMVAFARFADTICPLVQDHGTLLELLDGVEIARARSEDGTAIGEAVALAASRLRNAELEVERRADARGEDRDDGFRIKSKAIVLLTDGENNRGEIDPFSAAQLAADWNIRIYAIGIGSPRTVNFGGMRTRVGSGVDERTLRRMAENTGGRFWLAGDAEALRDVYRQIDALEKTEIETTRSTNTESRFAGFAALALMLVGLEVALSTLVLRRLP